jgi:zinc/manganese transport system substrate-binding protein
MKTFIKACLNQSLQPLLALLVACALGAPAAQAKLNVVATTSDFAAIAREIGGDRVEVSSLGRPTEDSHFVDAKPSLILKLSHADVLIEGGAELELGWLPALMDSARNPKILRGAPGNVVASAGIEMLEVPGVLDRSMGDVHAVGNPHFMTDPVNARILAECLAGAFGRLDAKSSDYFSANLRRFSEQLAIKLAEWQKRLGPFKGSRIVAYHNSWPYFARRFGLRIDLFLEPKPGIPPTPPHLAQVIKTMQEEKLKLIFVEPYLNWRTAETVARQTGATAVLVSQFPGGVKGTEGGYIALLDHLVNTVAQGLGAP